MPHDALARVPFAALPFGAGAFGERRAQADVRVTPGYAHPRYWAAVQLVGAP